MANRGKDKKEIDPEELMKRKFRAKCRFRAIGRLVMANSYWMIQAVDEYEGDDVKRRVEQAVRGKAKKKQLLSINDKALLNKPAQDRTDHEKKYIYRIIGGLKCFKRYPNHVKKKLAAVTYFKYYGPNRVIVRQHQEAHAMYFMVSGKVTVSHLIFDELLQEQVSVDLGVMYSGDLFGEVSLLHNIPRTATVTTNDHCEFLTLMNEDFKNVLQVSVQKQWDEVRHAMSAFTYFDALDEVARREGCIVAKLKAYDINDTLLGDGQGVANFVYFILSGHCQMIESLDVCVTTVHTGQTYYTLHDPYVPIEESEQDFDKKYFHAYKNLSKGSNSGTNVTIPADMPRKSNVEIDESVHLEPSITGKADGTVFCKRKSVVHYTSEIDGEAMSTEDEAWRQNSRLESESELQGDYCRGSAACRMSRSSDDNHRPSKDILFPPQRERLLSTRFSMIPEDPLLKPKNLRTFFMQVCQLNPGASFGFGENMRDRRIVARTPVFCMLMPKVWLLQRNTANIWSRIEHYLDKKIPTKKQLFKEFVAQRRWQEYRNLLVEDVVAQSNTVNYTSIHDVPYSIRMEEMLDI